MLSSFTVESLDQAEDHLIFAAVADDGTPLDEDAAARLFTLPGQIGQQAFSAPCADALNAHTSERQAAIERTISERNARFFEAEAEKLDGWADDIKLGLEREIKELDRQIKEARRAATLAPTLEEKLAGQKQIKALESLRKEKRWSLFEAQDKVDQHREELIAQIEGKLTLKSGRQPLFTLRWVLQT
jgi:adenine-specific DNA-methyltransferase